VLDGSLELPDVLISKRLAKSLMEYVRWVKKDGSFAVESSHVRVARLLKAREQDVGEGVKIEYYVVDGEEMTVAPASDWTGNVDRFYVWETMVYPPTERLLAAAYPTTDWRQWERARPPKVRAPKA
jgi:DNA polymerase elongation subunit (family B)